MSVLYQIIPTTKVHISSKYSSFLYSFFLIHIVSTMEWPYIHRLLCLSAPKFPTQSNHSLLNPILPVFILPLHIKDAFIRVGIGKEKKSHVITPEEKRITAFHETGHAILFHELPKVGRVYTISIIPTGMGAGGYTMQLPEKDEMYMTKGRMLQEIMVSLGGRIAEELVLDDITTGASADIRQATNIARHMVMRYGMSEKIGTINYEQETDDVFLGYDLGHENKHSEYINGEIDKEVRRIINECYAKAREIVVAHEDVLYKTADLLMEKEKITGEEFDALFAQIEAPATV